MTDSTTYSQLDDALRKLGFQKKAVPGRPIGYRHLESETVVLFRKHRPKDLVPAGTLAATRKLLIDRGVVEAERWDALLQTAVA